MSIGFLKKVSFFDIFSKKVLTNVSKSDTMYYRKEVNAMKTSKDVGLYIKRLREEKGLTQEQLGEIVGVQKAAVQKWESGTTKTLKRDVVKALSDYFEVSPARFVLKDEQEGETEKIMTVLEKRGDMLAFVNLLVDNEEEIDRDAIEKTMTMVETFFLDKKNKE